MLAWSAVEYEMQRLAIMSDWYACEPQWFVVYRLPSLTPIMLRNSWPSWNSDSRAISHRLYRSRGCAKSPLRHYPLILQSRQYSYIADIVGQQAVLCFGIILFTESGVLLVDDHEKCLFTHRLTNLAIEVPTCHSTTALLWYISFLLARTTMLLRSSPLCRNLEQSRRR